MSINANNFTLITIFKLSLPRRAVEVVALEPSTVFLHLRAAGGDGVVGGGGNGRCGATVG